MTRSRFVATASSSPEKNEDLERRWSDDLPAMAPAQFGRLALVHRGEGAVRPLLLLQQPARPGRSIEKQHPPGFRAAVLQACGTPRGMKAQVPGPPTVTSSPILNVTSPLRT